MEDKRIKVVKTWPELQLIRDIQVFIGFVNFYYCFTKGFNKITVLVVSMLKRITSATNEPRKPNNRDDNDNQGGGSTGKAADRDSDRIEKFSKAKIIQKLAKFKKPDCLKVKAVGIDFLIFEAKTAFFSLQKVFNKIPILYYFDLKRYIRMVFDAFGYAIMEVLSQLTSDKLFCNHMTSENIENLFKSEIG